MERSFYILMGTNLGDKHKNFEDARTLLHSQFVLKKLSGIYQSDPWGYESQQVYWNQVVELLTEREPLQVLEQLLAIEQELGRTRGAEGVYQDRLIDLDILAVGSEHIDHPRLQVPHPRLHLRKFALQPLVEVAPNWRHPLLNATAEELLLGCEDSSQTEKIEPR